MDPKTMLNDLEYAIYQNREFLDEYEELNLFHDHYHVLYATQ